MILALTCVFYMLFGAFLMAAILWPLLPAPTMSREASEPPLVRRPQLLRETVRNREGLPTSFVSGSTYEELMEDVLQALTLEGQHLLDREAKVRRASHER